MNSGIAIWNLISLRKHRKRKLIKSFFELRYSQHEYFTAFVDIYRVEGRNDTQIYLHQQTENEQSLSFSPQKRVAMIKNHKKNLWVKKRVKSLPSPLPKLPKTPWYLMVCVSIAFCCWFFLRQTWNLDFSIRLSLWLFFALCYCVMWCASHARCYEKKKKRERNETAFDDSGIGKGKLLNHVSKHLRFTNSLMNI